MSIKKRIRRVVRELSYIKQEALYLIGISTHNKVTDECCSDFSCCNPQCKSKLKDRIRYTYKDVTRRHRIIRYCRSK